MRGWSGTRDAYRRSTVEECRSLLIVWTIWGAIQAGLMYSVDRSLVESLTWVPIFVCVNAVLFGAQTLRTKIRMWMLMNMPWYQARACPFHPRGGNLAGCHRVWAGRWCRDRTR